MGMFFGNYNRPGPGVRKDAPPQKAVPRFFSILQRKFFDLVKLNLLFCIPVAVAAMLVYLLNLIVPYLIVDLMPVILLFPFIGGLTYVTRNYTREEHAFIYSDFKDAVKNNWKAFLIDGVIVYLIVTVLMVSIPYYLHAAPKGILSSVAAGICILIAMLVLFSQYYAPVLIVTFDLKIGQILKNSLIFAILGLWRNILITLLLGILILLLYLSQIMPLTIIIAVCFGIFLMFSYSSFLINFSVYPLINKMMIEPYKKQHEQENGEEEQEDETDFVDRS